MSQSHTIVRRYSPIEYMAFTNVLRYIAAGTLFVGAQASLTSHAKSSEYARKWRDSTQDISMNVQSFEFLILAAINANRHLELIVREQSAELLSCRMSRT